MTTILTRLRTHARANSGQFEVCLSIQEVREIVGELESKGWQPIGTSEHVPGDLADLWVVVTRDGRFVSQKRYPAARKWPNGWGDDGGASLEVEAIEDGDDGPVRYRRTVSHWMAVPEPPTITFCDHQWVDATNKYVTGGEICLKCYAIRATPPLSSPAEVAAFIDSMDGGTKRIEG